MADYANDELQIEHKKLEKNRHNKKKNVFRQREIYVIYAVKDLVAAEQLTRSPNRCMKYYRRHAIAQSDIKGSCI